MDLYNLKLFVDNENKLTDMSGSENKRYRSIIIYVISWIMKGHKLCLNMIVKNEAHIILENLTTIKQYIGYYVINDTGSTDNTISTIRNYFDSVGIKGKIVSHNYIDCTCHPENKYPFFHFGKNRTFALNEALNDPDNDCDYLIIIDADDLFMGNFDMSWLDSGHDCYEMMIYTSNKQTKYKRSHIIKKDPKIGWHYKGPLHEYLSHRINVTTGVIPEECHIYFRTLGDRSRNENKYADDAKIFRQLLEKKPNNDRYVFYCAQSYYDANDNKNAIIFYKRRASMGGWIEEVYYSLFRVAESMDRLGCPIEDIEKAYLDAYNYSVGTLERAEPLVNLAVKYRGLRNFQKAFTFAKKSANIKYPSCRLFFNEHVYLFSRYEELAISAYYCDEYMECYNNYYKLLRGNVQKDSLQRLTNGIGFAIKKLRDTNTHTILIYASHKSLTDNECNFINCLCSIYLVVLVGSVVSVYDDRLDSEIDIHRGGHEIFFEKMKLFRKKIMLMLDNIDLLVIDLAIIRELGNDSNMVIIKDDTYKIYTSTGAYCIIEEPKITGCHIIDLEKRTDMLYNTLNVRSDIAGILNINDIPGPIQLVPCDQLSISCVPRKKDNVEKKHVLQKFYDEYPQISGISLLLGKLCIDSCDIENVESYLLKSMKLRNDGEFQEAYDLANEFLKTADAMNISEKLREDLMKARDRNIPMIADSTLCEINTEELMPSNRSHAQNKTKIALTMTTCKRYNLFCKTVRSFVNCCTDKHLITEWICVDDNSSEEDRAEMIKNFPFFTYIFKKPDDKGHFVSMNIIREKVIGKYDYIVHVEDDYHFIQKRNYITDAIAILANEPTIGQVFFNSYYASLPHHEQPMRGGTRLHKHGVNYILHEYHVPGTPAYDEFIKRINNGLNCGYWPHFSFRPSVTKVSALEIVGEFVGATHFEMQYAYEYVEHGYSSVFFDNFSAIDMGTNCGSYWLNSVPQFSLPPNRKLDIRVVYTDRNAWKKFKTHNHSYLRDFTIERTPCIGTSSAATLTKTSLDIFENNNFNFRRSVIGQISSTISILENFLLSKSEYLCIMYDIAIRSDKSKYQTIYDLLQDNEFDYCNLTNSINNFMTSPAYIVSKKYADHILSTIKEQKLNTVSEIKSYRTPSYGIEIYFPEMENEKDIIDHMTMIISDDYFLEVPGFKFYSQLDSVGGDSSYNHLSTVLELADLCLENNMKAFNTLGWIKKSIVPIDKFIAPSIFTTPNQGLYVRTDQQ